MQKDDVNKPLKKLRSYKANCAFTAHNGVVNIVVDCFASKKVSGRITDAVSTLLQLFANSISVW